MANPTDNPMPVEHDYLGNCLTENAVYDCPACGVAGCDVCHDHDEPRGECGQCPRCPECGDASAKET